MGPLDASRPWSTADIVGVHRFLQRLWRNVVDEDTGELRVVDEPADDETRRLLHRTIAAVRADMGDARVQHRDRRADRAEQPPHAGGRRARARAARGRRAAGADARAARAARRRGAVGAARPRRRRSPTSRSPRPTPRCSSTTRSRSRCRSTARCGRGSRSPPAPSEAEHEAAARADARIAELLDGGDRAQGRRRARPDRQLRRSADRAAALPRRAAAGRFGGCRCASRPQLFLPARSTSSVFRALAPGGGAPWPQIPPHAVRDEREFWDRQFDDDGRAAAPRSGEPDVTRDPRDACRAAARRSWSAHATCPLGAITRWSSACATGAATRGSASWRSCSSRSSPGSSGTGSASVARAGARRRAERADATASAPRPPRRRRRRDDRRRATRGTIAGDQPAAPRDRGARRGRGHARRAWSSCAPGRG